MDVLGCQWMSTIEATVEKLKSLPPEKLQEVAAFIQRLTLPGSTPVKLPLHLAIGLFVSEDATLGQAAEVAGLTQAEFLRELGKRRIPIHYGSEELMADLQVVETLAGK